jgi:hypothetical protein
VKYGLETNLSDLMALDIAKLYTISMITGQVTNDELLAIYLLISVFGK